MLQSRSHADSSGREAYSHRSSPSTSTLIDQAQNGSFAAPVEVYVRIDEFIGEHVSAPQLLSGDVLPHDLIRKAYLALTSLDHRDSTQRAYFFSIGAAAIRRRLVDHAKTTDQPTSADVRPLSSETIDTLLAPDAALSTLSAATTTVLDDALAQLESDHPYQAQIIECRFFGAMPVETIASALDRSPDTVQAADADARAWLRQHLSPSAE